jgi:biotin carboxylase
MLRPGEPEPAKVAEAFARSRVGRVIVEELVEKAGWQVCGDAFVQDGEIAFVELGDGHFRDDGVYFAPYGETFPSRHTPPVLRQVRDLVARIVADVGFRTGPINIDVLITREGEPFVVEIGPRAGGNHIPTAICLRTGADIVGATVEACLDLQFQFPRDASPRKRPIASYMLHSRSNGVFRGVALSAEIERRLLESTLYVQPGAIAATFSTGSDALGNMLLGFDSPAEMEQVMATIDEHVILDIETLAPLA